MSFRSSARFNRLGFPSPWVVSIALSSSPDGSVIYGVAYNSDQTEGQAWLWTHANGFTLIPRLTGHVFITPFVYGNTDGTVVTGLSYTSGFGAAKLWRWTSGGGTVSLYTGYAQPYAMTPDGSVIVGDSFVWTVGGGFASLALPTGGSYAIAYGVSPDGTVIVGQADDTTHSAGTATSWSSDGSTVTVIGEPPGAEWDHTVGYGAGQFTSWDGSKIVGWSQDAITSNERPWIWDGVSFETIPQMIGTEKTFPLFGTKSLKSIVCIAYPAPDYLGHFYRYNRPQGTKKHYNFAPFAGTAPFGSANAYILPSDVKEPDFTTGTEQAVRVALLK